MSIYCINELIKRTRLECKMSQEDLAIGICAVSTLSKIENGIVEPNRSTVEELMNRMGKSKGLYGAFSSEEAYECFGLKQGIIKHILRKDQQSVNKEVQINQELLRKDQSFFTFLIIYQNLMNTDDGIVKCTKALEDLIRKEDPKTDWVRLQEHIYSVEQLIYYLYLSKCYGGLKQEEKRYSILDSIQDYISKEINYEGEYDDLAIVIQKELTDLFTKKGEYEQALQYIEIAYTECISRKKYSHLREICEQKSVIYDALNDQESRSECKQYVQILDDIFREKYYPVKIKTSLQQIPHFYS